MEQCKNDIKRWSILPISRFGRVNSVKMNIVPKLLHNISSIINFHTTVIFFKAFNQMISSFISNDKTALIRKEFIERPKVGGLSLLNLRSYYWAVNFNAISLWLKNCNVMARAWLQRKINLCFLHSLPAMFCASLPSHADNIIGNIIVTQLLHIVKQFKNCLGDQNISVHSQAR